MSLIKSITPEVLEQLDSSRLVKEYAAANERKAEIDQLMSSIIAELQKRSVEQIDDGTVNFTRVACDDGAMTTYKACSVKVISPVGLQRFMGSDLFNSVFKVEKSVNYKAVKSFEDVLKAIGTGDYDFNASMEEVYRSLGADDAQRKMLDKKLKGVPEKDYLLLNSIFGDGDYEVELFMITKVKNAERIRVFFPEADAEFLSNLKKYFYVNESIKTSFTGEK